MKTSNPKILSIYTSFIIVFIFAFTYILLSFFYLVHFHWSVVLLIGIILFVSCFFLLNYVLEKFIYEKIRLIYKTIHNLKVAKTNEKYFLNKEGDILHNVNQEVMKWAQNNKEEIDQLKRMENYRREFVGNVSHELKTPIFNIQGYILTLLDGGLEDNKINRDYLLRTEKSVDRMISIIEDLEVISKLESGELIINYKKFDIIDLAKETIEFLEIKADKKNINIYFAENYEKPIYIFADREKISQVLLNLIDNSIKYGNENGKTKISFFDMDENVLIEITDNGIGLEKKDIQRVFERFYRVDKSRSREQGGSGLGLSIVKHIIEAHEQSINVRSAIGIGTTFAFTLKKSF